MAPLGASGEDAPDVLYQFTIATAQSVTAEVIPDAAEGQLLRPVVYVRGPGSLSCSSTLPLDQKGCAVASAYGGTATLMLPNLAPGTYYLWVDGAGLGSGKFAVKLR